MKKQRRFIGFLNEELVKMQGYIDEKEELYKEIQKELKQRAYDKKMQDINVLEILQELRKREGCKYEYERCDK